MDEEYFADLTPWKTSVAALVTKAPPQQHQLPAHPPMPPPRRLRPKAKLPPHRLLQRRPPAHLPQLPAHHPPPMPQAVRPPTLPQATAAG